ncbi:MAG: protein arginine kinase [Bacillota bacterium]
MSQDFTARAASKWMEASGPDGDVVISSRVRLARNLSGVPFPHGMGPDEASKVLAAVKSAVAEINRDNPLPLSVLSLDDLEPVARQVLVEKHLVSPQHAAGGASRAVVLREDEAVSIMVNEEDHLRIQCLFPGLQVAEAWRLASRIDDGLESRMDYAFEEGHGYLTACPTNVGTGLRASVMVHLPALVMTNQAGRILSAITKFGLLVRGLYGEGTEASGNLFQVSNQVTLGQSEEEIIANLEAVARQIIDQERQTRSALARDMGDQLADRVWRAMGAVSNARIVTSQEAMQLLSDVRLGASMGILSGVDQRVLNELMVTTRPGFLQQLAGKELSPGERDLRRAEILRESFPNRP